MLETLPLVHLRIEVGLPLYFGLLFLFIRTKLE